jgi:hypothetical protein
MYTNRSLCLQNVNKHEKQKINDLFLLPRYIQVHYCAPVALNSRVSGPIINPYKSKQQIYSNSTRTSKMAMVHTSFPVGPNPTKLEHKTRTVGHMAFVYLSEEVLPLPLLP